MIISKIIIMIETGVGLKDERPTRQRRVGRSIRQADKCLLAFGEFDVHLFKTA